MHYLADLEERLNEQSRVTTGSAERTRQRLEFLEEMDESEMPSMGLSLRQRVAAAFVSLGFKIDPEAAHEFAATERAA